MVDYCPINLMIADYFNKPLQGKDFKIFRDVIMGYAHIDTLLTADLPIKERVKKCNNIKMIEKPTVPCIKKIGKLIIS